MARIEDPGVGAADVYKLRHARVLCFGRGDKHEDVRVSSDSYSIPFHCSQEEEEEEEEVKVDDDKHRMVLDVFHRVEKEMDRWRRR